MEYVVRLLHQEQYRENVKKIARLEADRIYCRHNMEHFMDVARLAQIRNLKEQLGLDEEMIYLYALIHDIGRLKEYDSVCKKMKKKGLESDSDSALEKINDLIGVRAICVYVDAIYRVSDYLKCIEKKCYTDENKIEVRTPELFRSITIMIADFTKEHPDRTLWRFWQVESKLKSVAKT